MASTSTPQHLLTILSEPSFMDRLNAVEEELDCNPAYTYNQVTCLYLLPGKPPSPITRCVCFTDYLSLPLSQAAVEGTADEDCLAYRTRSKLRLVNIPLGQLEAELLAPDITADMYDQGTAQQKEDRHWTEWLQGLMAPDNEGLKLHIKSLCFEF